MKLEKYGKENEYSYTLGAFPTFELIKNKPEKVEAVLIHSKATHTADLDKLLKLCKDNKIKIEQDDRTINKLSPKENCFVMGVFKKYRTKHTANKQVVLHNPSDMGNLGTIMRTMVGFGYTDLVIIKPAVDYFNPKVVRASMGAVFSLNVVECEDIESYLKSNSYQKYFFMLNGKNKLGGFIPPKQNYALVFGNEAHGLPNNLLTVGESVVIQHSNKIDSLNLPISVGMALYEFNR